MHPGPVAISPLAATFARQRYAVIPGMISPQQARALSNHLDTINAEGRMSLEDPFVPRTPSTYADTAIERLLIELDPRMQFYAGLPLYPTYSFARIYKHGDVLSPHRDRNACEISISLNLGQQPDEPW